MKEVVQSKKLRRFLESKYYEDPNIGTHPIYVVQDEGSYKYIDDNHLVVTYKDSAEKLIYVLILASDYRCGVFDLDEMTENYDTYDTAEEAIEAFNKRARQNIKY